MNAETGDDWRARVGERDDPGRVLDLSRAREPGRGRDAECPEQISVLGWRDILWRVLWSISADRVLSTSGSVAFFALLAVLPGVTAIVSLYGLFADASTIGNHLTILAGILPGGVQAVISDQIILLARQPNETLGAAFTIALLVALVSANSGVAALFDALNVVYGEQEKRRSFSVLRYYLPFHSRRHCVRALIAILGRRGPATRPEVHRLSDDKRRAFEPPAMAHPPRYADRKPRFHLPLRPKPPRRSLAMGHVGEHHRGGAVDRGLHAVLVVSRNLRQL